MIVVQHHIIENYITLRHSITRSAQTEAFLCDSEDQTKEIIHSNLTSGRTQFLSTSPSFMMVSLRDNYPTNKLH